MKVLGVSGRDRDAAAALSIDGRVVAAVAEESFARVPNIGYARTGGFPHAAAHACLAGAGLEAPDVEQIVIVDDGGARPPLSVNGPFRGITVRELASERADALHALGDTDADLVIVAGVEPGNISLFRRAGSRLGPREDVPGADGLLKTARRMASLLGVNGLDPFAGLDRVSIGGRPEYQAHLGTALEWQSGIVADDERLSELVAEISGEHSGRLAEPDSLNTKVQQLRQSLASSYLHRVAEVVGAAALQGAESGRAQNLAAGGVMFSNAIINTHLTQLFGHQLRFADVPELRGRALGAAASEPGATASAGKGPAFTDEEIKQTLDNCRLDYVYEPEWPRLVARVSAMLAQGKVVAWFQGAMPFGPRPDGSRSTLTDPSSRYARQNVNGYLRQVPIDEPLPMALAPSARDKTLESVPTATAVVDAAVRADARPRLAGAVDWQNRVRLQAWHPDPSSQFHQLLEYHYATTGTPGLIETGLANQNEPLACTPRDAVRTMYSSAIDALVIGRFLLMKDYWLLRSQER